MNKYSLSDEVVEAIINIGKRYDIRKIILFGSRARGDYKERSDIDIAVCGGNTEEFGIDVEAEVPTLLKFDVVQLDKPVQQALIESINKEGVIIYEKV